MILGWAFALFVLVILLPYIVVAGVCCYYKLCRTGTPRYRRLTSRVVTEDLNSTLPSSTVVCTDVSPTNVEVCVCLGGTGDSRKGRKEIESETEKWKSKIEFGCMESCPYLYE